MKAAYRREVLVCNFWAASFKCLKMKRGWSVLLPGKKLCIFGIFGRNIIKYTVIYDVCVRFWPTLWIRRMTHTCFKVCVCVCDLTTCPVVCDDAGPFPPPLSANQWGLCEWMLGEHQQPSQQQDLQPQPRTSCALSDQILHVRYFLSSVLILHLGWTIFQQSRGCGATWKLLLLASNLAKSVPLFTNFVPRWLVHFLM